DRGPSALLARFTDRSRAGAGQRRGPDGGNVTPHPCRAAWPTGRHGPRDHGGWRMSTGEAFASRDETTPRPEFELALRGYDKRQVDYYIEQTEHTIATLTSERDWAFNQARELTAQVQQLQAELHELRQRPARVD